MARSEDGRAPPGARVGSELHVRGTVAPLADFEDYQRRRGAGAAVEVASWAATGGARGGLAGALDAARERAARGLGTGLRAPEAALLRGMVLGQDEAIADAAKTDFQRSGLAHLLAVSGQNVLLLSTLVLALCALTGLPLRARLAAAMLLVAVYVPLAGGGPSIQRAGVMGIARAGRRARRTSVLALVRARAGGGGHARVEPARGRGTGLAALVRRRGGTARARARHARGADAAARAGARSGCGRDHGRGDRGDRAAGGAALRAGLAGLAAGQPARGRWSSRP